MSKPTYHVLENGKPFWKVVLSDGPPIGGEASKCRNWTMVAGFDSWQDAVDFCERMNKS